MKRNWGRIYALDKRDKKYLIQVKESKRTSKVWKDDYWTGNQGNTPLCVGFSFSHWLSSSPILQWLPPEGIYRLAQTFDEWETESYEGTSVRGGAKALQLLGYISEYNWAFEVDTLINTVLEIGPVVVGTNWYSKMNTPNQDGLVTVKGQVLGGHAYLISGVNKKTELCRIRNSWGLSWSLQGRAFISFSDMDRLIKEEGEVCLGIESNVNKPVSQ